MLHGQPGSERAFHSCMLLPSSLRLYLLHALPSLEAAPTSPYINELTHHCAHLDRPVMTATPVADQIFVAGDTANARGTHSALPPLAAQQDAWQVFQQQPLDQDLERRPSEESHSAMPSVSLADGLDASPRPRQRRSLDISRCGFGCHA